MKIQELAHDARNPRTITDSKLKQLKKALIEFGDLSGIVFNTRTKQLVGGHQRTKLIDDKTPVIITKRFDKPTRTGTIAQGYVELKGERFSYREVSWEAVKQKAAAIAANKNAGEWDMEQLSATLKELTHFDLDFDLDLTMFSTKELADLPNPIEVAAHTRKKSDPKEPKPPKCKAGETYQLGSSQLRCGPDDLEFCDQVIDGWKDYSGEDAKLLPLPLMRKPAKQVGKQVLDG
jgi:hypothetical protein